MIRHLKYSENGLPGEMNGKEESRRFERKAVNMNMICILQYLVHRQG